MIVPSIDPNVHFDGLQALFGDLQIKAGDLPDLDQVVVLCFTNRCGSNFLADALAGSGHLNMAREMIDSGFARGAVPDAGSMAEFLSVEIGRHMVGRRFILKAAPNHLDVMARCGLLDVWRDRLHFVYIERADRLAQAISWVIAEQTEEWVAGYIGRNGRDPTYDRAAIIAAIEWFASCNSYFDRFFGLNGIVPANVLYEDLVRAPGQAVAEIGAGLGIPLQFEPARVQMVRQAGPRNEDWRARFLAGE